MHSNLTFVTSSLLFRINVTKVIQDHFVLRSVVNFCDFILEIGVVFRSQNERVP